MSDYIIDTYLVPQKADMEKWLDAIEKESSLDVCYPKVRQQLIYWASTYIHCANFNTVLLENAEHTINLQKACARINQLEAENKELKKFVRFCYDNSKEGYILREALNLIELYRNSPQGPIQATLK